MTLGETVAPPPGFVTLCETVPATCADPMASPQALEAVRLWAGQARWASVFAAAGLGTQTASDDPAVRPAATMSKAGRSPAAVRAAKDAVRKRARLTKPGRSAEPSPPDAAAFAEIQAVNSRINRLIQPSTDMETFGLPDLWTAPSDPGARGDCEDYVLAKRRALIEIGVDADRLSIALVTTRRGQAHAVLLVATEQGEQVLDNLSPWIVRWDQAPYDWQARQVPGDPLRWVRPASGR